MRLAGTVALVLLAGCGAGSLGLRSVASLDVFSVVDHTPDGSADRNTRQGLKDAIPRMAMDRGLLRDSPGRGKQVTVRAEITDFPRRGWSKGMGGAPWLYADPITVHYKVEDESGQVLGETAISTHPLDAVDAPDDPLVYTQAVAFVRWLGGR